jgi:hypothetical protein
MINPDPTFPVFLAHISTQLRIVCRELHMGEITATVVDIFLATGLCAGRCVHPSTVAAYEQKYNMASAASHADGSGNQGAWTVAVSCE